jgi:hypothetical protein
MLPSSNEKSENLISKKENKNQSGVHGTLWRTEEKESE